MLDKRTNIEALVVHGEEAVSANPEKIKVADESGATNKDQVAVDFNSELTADQKEEASDFKFEKVHFNRIIYSIRDLIMVFNKRNGEGLNPILDGQGLARIKTMEKSLIVALDKSPVDLEAINREIKILIKVIESDGNRSRGGGRTKDNPESLSLLSAKFRNLMKDCSQLASYIPRDVRNSQIIEVRNYLVALSQASEKQMKLAERRANILRS